ncbi:MAG: TolC family protein [Gammaproteobacteria bacterium]
MFVFTACARIEYQPEPLDPVRIQASVQERNLDEQAFLDYLAALADESQSGSEPSWNLRLLTLAAFYHNPKMQVAYEELNLHKARLQTASRRINPTLNVPLEHHSDTSGNVSPWMIGLIPDFVYERKGKREARIDQAKAGLESAKFHIREVAWNLRDRLHAAYLEYYSALEEKRLASARNELLRQRLLALQQRHEGGHIGGAEVAGAEVELHKSELVLGNLQTRVGNAYHQLVGLTGLQTDNFRDVEIQFRGFENLSRITGMDRDDFRATALLERADMRKALSDYEALEYGLRLEIEKQYPDITLSPGLIFDQSDKIWAIGSAWMLPLFHNNEGPIAEALAERSIMQARVMELQGGILNRLDAELDNFESMKHNLEKAEQLHVKAKSAVAAVENQYEQGYSDRLNMIDAKLNLVDSRRRVLGSRLSLLASFSRLESITQEPLYRDFDLDKSVELLYSLDESSK